MIWEIHLLSSDPVDKLEETIFQFLALEPCSVERHHVGGSVLVKMSPEVFLKPFENLQGEAERLSITTRIFTYRPKCYFS